VLANQSTEASIEGPALRFITLDGDPSHAAKDDTTRKLVKSNASRSRKALAGFQGSPNYTGPSPVPTLNSGLAAGKSRFSLSSRKPLKRVRRQAASHSGAKFEHGYLKSDTTSAPRETIVYSVSNLEIPNDAHRPSHGSLRSIQFQPQDSPAPLPAIKKSKTQTMAQQRMYTPFLIPDESIGSATSNLETVLSQVKDMQHMFYDLVGLARRDDATFHASLSIASVYYDAGANDLFHCQQTLSLVFQRLSNCALRTSDETIGAVGLLVVYNVRLFNHLQTALYAY